MKFNVLFFFFSLFITGSATAQNIVGKWKTIDDQSNEPRSIVEIFEKNGNYYGRITHLFTKPGEDPDPSCNECDKDDDRYGKKVKGMEILRGLKRSGSEFTGGKVLDPENGKVYSCKIWIEDAKLKLRGYWGPFYRTQVWLRAQE